MRFAVIQRKHVDGTMNKRNATVKSSNKQTIILLLDIIMSMYFDFYEDYKHFVIKVNIVLFEENHDLF